MPCLHKIANICGSKNSYIATLVEHHSRYLMLAKVEDSKSSTVIAALINQGTYKTKLKKDGWTVVTRDKKLSAQWEHTVLVTATGAEVLTLRDSER